MRFLRSCYLVVAIILAGAVISTACLQHYMSKVSITISCDDPADEDGSNEYEDDKEHSTYLIAFINPPFYQSPDLYYLEEPTDHSPEITVPPPEV